MKRNWNNIIVGVLLGVCLTLVLGAADDEPATEKYQLAAAANYVWVMDTQTGQVWTAEKRTVEDTSSWIVSAIN